MDTLFDNGQGSAAPSIVVTAGGNVPVSQGGKQLSVEANGSSNNSNNNIGNGQGFLSGLLPSTMLQQVQHQQQNTNNLAPAMHGHGVGLETTQLSQHQQPMHHTMHSIQGNACPSLPHIMDNHHHHGQTMNLGHQHGGHPMNHGPAHPTSHPVSHHAHTSQQFLPFGMNFNHNNMGNNGGPATQQQMNPFHHYHGPQIPNQQPAHTMNMGMNPLQQSCFIPHPACMHFQQNPQSITALNNQRASANVGWMTGPQPVVNQNNMAPGNNIHSTNNLASCAANQNGNATKIVTVSMNKSQPPPPPPPDPNALPGGLEILWRELPIDCQKLMAPQDIPDTARFRGYFTVCELLVLKRALETRYLGAIKALPCPLQQTSMNKPSSSTGSGNKSEGHSSRRGVKRGGGNKERNSNKHVRSSENYQQSASAKQAEGNRQLQDNNAATANAQNTNTNMNNNMGNCGEQRPVPEDQDENSLGELMISLDNMKHEIHTSVAPVVTGVGGAVKAAMEALTTSNTTTDQSNAGGNQTSCATNKESDEMLLITGKDSDSDELVINEGENAHESNNVTAVVVATSSETPENNASFENLNHQKESSGNNIMRVIPLLPSMPAFSSLFSDKKNAEMREVTMVSTSNAPSCLTITEVDDKSEQDAVEENHTQLQLALSSISEDSTANNDATSSNTTVNNAVQGPLFEGRQTGLPPPYRTATLVIKLLQIGAYHIRSFSGANPNRLRVLFNTQRMTYECQLPVLPVQNPGAGSTPHLVRKVLTVDIGFEQISMMRFSSDSMWMRVEGAPLLTIAVNQAQDEAPTQLLSPQDQFLLEQIEKGQLKLSPIHQLYFLNERLVQSLETQLREHPRFRHILMDCEGPNGQHH